MDNPKDDLPPADPFGSEYSRSSERGSESDHQPEWETHENIERQKKADEQNRSQ